MKLVLVDTTIGEELIGGAQMFLPGLLAGLMERGHDVYLITKGVPNERVRPRIEASGAVVHSNIWEINSLVDDSAPVLAAWVNDLAPDVFLISSSGDMGWVVLPLLDPGIATLTIGHNDSETFYMPARHYARFLTRAVGVSEEICETYVKDCGIEAGRVDWIPYGVRSSESGPVGAVPSEGISNSNHPNQLQTFINSLGQGDRGTGPLKLIYVGRLDEGQKRVSDLIETAKRLSANGIAYVLDVVGDGEEMPAFKQALASEIAAGGVVLHGWLAGDGVIERMRAAEIFLLTSNFEGFCIALIEAMANGCCPIVTDIRSGNKQLVRNGENGFIVPVGDVDGFVEKIACLGTDRDKLLEFRQRAWETGKKYSVERMVESYEKCFERAIADARSNPRTPDPAFPLMESCRSKYPLWLRRLKAKAKNLATN